MKLYYGISNLNLYKVFIKLQCKFYLQTVITNVHFFNYIYKINFTQNFKFYIQNFIFSFEKFFI